MDAAGQSPPEQLKDAQIMQASHSPKKKKKKPKDTGEKSSSSTTCSNSIYAVQGQQQRL